EGDDELVGLHAAFVEAVVVGIRGAAVRAIGAEAHSDRQVEPIDLALRDLRARIGEARAILIDLRLLDADRVLALRESRLEDVPRDARELACMLVVRRAL